jgi:cobalt-zinc-cadmium efflux system protein
VAIGMWVLPRTWVLLKSSVNILLEGVPEEVDMAQIQAALLAVPGVRSLHDLHVWAISSGKTSLTVHVVHAPDSDPAALLDALRTVLKEQFAISHVTIQCELVACDQADERFHFADADAAHDEEAGHAHGQTSP